MSIGRQTTIKRPCEFKRGLALHSGVEVALRCLPAPAGYGVRFVRIDLPGEPEIPAHLDYLDAANLDRQTSLVNNGARVGTVEHLLASCLGLGIDNLRVELDGPELPLYDGSALLLATQLNGAGIRELNEPREAIRISEPFVYQDNSAQITALPCNDLELTFFAHFAHPAIGTQTFNLFIEPKAFLSELAPARTFCTAEDVEVLRAQGLIRGGTPDCAIVFDKHGPQNTKLRFKNEAARHKTLDLLGDLFLLGRPLRGLIMASRSGHRIHADFLREFLKETRTDEQL